MASPDDKMDVPIDRVLYWTCKLMDRTVTVAGLELSDAEIDALDGYFEREDELRLAYMVALRLRWQEVREHCESIGLTGVTREMVYDNPFLIAAAYGKFCGFQET